MKEKLAQSMNLLNDLKSHQSEVEQERTEHSSELLKVREELLQSKQKIEDERIGREKERRRHREEVERISYERSMKESELINQLQEKESLIDSQNKMLTDQKSSFNKQKEQ